MDVLQFDVKTTWPTLNDAVLLPMSGDPTKLPPAEPEQQTKPPPESIPDSESASPYEPEQIPPLPNPGQPSPEPNSPGQPMIWAFRDDQDRADIGEA